MKVLTGGCSFSAHLVLNKLAWPFHLKHKGLDITNTAEMASGNQIICDRICWGLEKGGFDTVIVMWSSPYRFEFLINKENSEYKKVYSDMEGQTSFTNFFLNGVSESHSDSNWLRVGGGFGIWKFKNQYLNHLTKNYISNHFNYEYQFIQTCKSIVIVQSLCKSLGIRLINTCWQNIWDDLYSSDLRIGSNWINENTIESLKNKEVEYRPVIDLYPNAKHWYNLIDWDTWVFYEKDGVVRGGLGEFAVIENNDVLDQSHPNVESQKLWADFIFNKSLKSVI